LARHHGSERLTWAGRAFGAAVAWLQSTESDPELQAPSDFGPAAATAVRWVELLSTGFDSDACYESSASTSAAASHSSYSSPDQPRTVVRR